MPEREWKVGDRIALEFECAYLDTDKEPWWHICLNGAEKGSGHNYFNHLELTTARLIERPIQVGDRVRDKTTKLEGLVLAIDGDWCWVRHGEDHHETSEPADLERIP